MYQLLVVDDEESVVDSISDTMPWESVRIMQVHKAYSAAEALDLMNKHAIDILITDIRMPDMDGLQLIDHIRKSWTHTKCIVLTGYAEFEYAKHALVVQTEDYLLKPVSDDDLLQVVQRVVLKLDKEWEETSSHRRAVQTLRENLPILQGRLLYDLLQGRRFTLGLLAEKLDMFKIAVENGDPFSLLIVRMEPNFHRYDTKDLSLMEYALANIAQEIFDPHYELWNCKDAHDFLVFLLKAKSVNSDSANESKGHELLERLTIQLQTGVSLTLGADISVIVSGGGVFPDDVSGVYKETVTALRNRIGNDRGLFVTVSDRHILPKMNALRALYEPPLFINLLEAGRWEEAKRKLLFVFDELAAAWSTSKEHIMEVFHTLSGNLYYITHINGKSFTDLLPVNTSLVVGESGEISVEKLRLWACSALERIRSDVQTEMEDSRSLIVKQVREYIEANLNRDVSLQAIADSVFLHPVYLSKLYKLETGETLSDYLFRFRMEKAAYLVKHTDLRIYEITELVGYQNAAYFIKVFHKHFGITPQKYRS